MAEDLRNWLRTSDPFQNYLYSYPHKTAYRGFPQPLDLAGLWKDERKDSLFLYAHIPFCRSKCAFCNLFSLQNPLEGMVDLYLDAMERQALAVREALGEHRFAGWAVGGGTPSLLDIPQLARLFAILGALNVDLRAQPGSIEVSPDTVTPEKLAFLRESGIERISIGVQSLVGTEAARMGRRQPDGALESVLEEISRHAFPVFNLDLIYGIPGQTTRSWLESLERAVSFSPGEIFLYPLYTRAHTALFRSAPQTPAVADLRMELYEAGRDFLLSCGYVQDSMRLFRKPGIAGEERGGEYSCQEDGMVGLGTNARSYTSRVHYATRYAARKPQIAALLKEYAGTSKEGFSQAVHGIVLDLEDRKRRFLVKSLLKSRGLVREDYLKAFGTDAWQDFPELAVLEELGMAWREPGGVRLTPLGMSRSDQIGTWFIAPRIRRLMQEWAEP